MTTRDLEIRLKATAQTSEIKNLERLIQDLTRQFQQSQAQFKSSGQAAKGLASDLKLLNAEEAKLVTVNARAAAATERLAQTQERSAAVAARTKTAEAGVSTARERTRATTARAETAEIGIEKARQQLRAATTRAEAAEERLAKQRERSANKAQGLQKSLFSLKQATVAYVLAAAGAIEAAKKLYGALKEGAALRTAANQFDILTAKIGTTADALLGRMREATRGFVTDAQLIASANDIISLGLAKNEEDVAQLAAVVGGLGLDMQQVILTFANNSKARLDSLGLSVEGVTLRAKELERQGFQGDAFDAAVLELLTERYNEMAGAIDNVQAATTRAEVATQNFIDSAKKGLAQGFGNLLLSSENYEKGVAALEEAHRRGFISGEEYRAGMIGIQTAVDGTTAESDRAISRLAAMDAQQARSAASADKLLEKYRQYPDVLRNVWTGFDDLADAAAYQQLVNKDAGQATDGIVIGYKDVAAAADRREEAERAATEATEAATAADEAAATARRALTAATGDYFTAATKAGDKALFTPEGVTNQEAINAALYESADAAGASATQLALLGVATGQLSEAQAIAALKAAALQEKIAGLGAKIAEGLNIDAALRELQGFQTELDKQDFNVKIHPEITTQKAGAARDAARGAGAGIPEDGIVIPVVADTADAYAGIDEFFAKADAGAAKIYKARVKAETAAANADIDSLWTKAIELSEQRFKIHFEYEVSGSPPSIPSGASVPGRAAGGSVSGGSPYIVGERGPELFVPRGSGNIVPNNQMNNRINLTININGGNSRDASSIATNVRDELLSAFNQLGVSVE